MDHDMKAVHPSTSYVISRGIEFQFAISLYLSLSWSELDLEEVKNQGRKERKETSNFNFLNTVFSGTSAPSVTYNCGADWKILYFGKN